MNFRGTESIISTSIFMAALKIANNFSRQKVVFPSSLINIGLDKMGKEISACTNLGMDLYLYICIFYFLFLFALKWT